MSKWKLKNITELATNYKTSNWWESRFEPIPLSKPTSTYCIKKLRVFLGGRETMVKISLIKEVIVMT